MPVPGRAVIGQQRRTSVGLTISVALHIAAVACALYLVQARPPPAPRSLTPVAPRLVSLVFVPKNPRDLPAPPAPRPLPPTKVAIRTEEPSPELPRILPPRAFENRRAEVAPPPESLPAEALPTPVPPKSTATVMVGAFPNNVAAVRTPEPGRQLERAGFDAPTERASEPKRGTATVGAFDRPRAAGDLRSPSQTQADTVATETGFNRAAAAAPPAPESRVIRETGFGNTNSRERPRPAESQPSAVVTPSGFANARESQPVSKATPPSQPDIVPVDVLSKPTPTYTDAARKLKIEGEVLLEVEFASTGSVRVLRVVRGLGHGLDEAAVRAAQQIRFKPAHAGGRPVDSRATVHIVFRLA